MNLVEECNRCFLFVRVNRGTSWSLRRLSNLGPVISQRARGSLINPFSFWAHVLMILLLCFVCCCQAEPEGFSHFHLYVCAAFLVHWRKEILEEKDFQVSLEIFLLYLCVCVCCLCHASHNSQSCSKCPRSSPSILINSGGHWVVAGALAWWLWQLL